MSIHEDLREELLSVIAAAPELAPDARSHLADVFLDRVEQEYRLVPRSERDDGVPQRSTFSRLPSPWPLVPLMLGMAALLWAVTGSLFVLGHPPLLLFVVLVAFAFRSRRWGRRRHVYL